MIGPIVLAVVLVALAAGALVATFVSRDPRRIRAVGWAVIGLAAAGFAAGFGLGLLALNGGVHSIIYSATGDKAPVRSRSLNEALLYPVVGLLAVGPLMACGSVALARVRRLRRQEEATRLTAPPPAPAPRA